MIRRLDDRTSVSGQLRPEEIAGLAERGIAMVVNNRPDGEEPGQPLAADIEAAAEAAGMSYRHVPIIRGIGPADVAAMRDALHAAGDGQTLAFCRSGNRSALAWALAMREDGASAEEIAEKVTAAGFDVTPIAHLL
ncbi:MAG TPA: TIGR01244 family sulfur transferase [Sphingomicrobium sp.]|nr:TIGR01244 family sulfur transferase [Sphingomicrobium sp.]